MLAFSGVDAIPIEHWLLTPYSGIFGLFKIDQERQIDHEAGRAGILLGRRPDIAARQGCRDHGWWTRNRSGNCVPARRSRRRSRDRRCQRAERCRSEIRRRFQAKAVGALLDVTNSKSVAALAALAEKAFGRLDIWVNNAGVFPPSGIIETTDEQWELVQNVNLRGTFFGCREAGKRMAAVGSGVIVNITSVSGYRGRASVGHYGAAKHGVAGLTKSLGVELGPKGVRGRRLTLHDRNAGTE